MLLPVPPGGHALALHSPCGTEPVRSLFVDGTVVRGRQGAGAALRLADGEVRLGRARLDSFGADSTEAEVNALDWALGWLLSQGPAQPTVVYLDSYQALEHLQRQSGRYAALDTLPERLREAGVVRLQNIERRRNKLADEQARRALQ